MTRNPYAAVELLEGRQLFAASPAILTTVVNPANGHTYHLLAEADWKESQAAAIALGGSPMSEHGVGRNPVKQELLACLYGSDGVAGVVSFTTKDPADFLRPDEQFAALEHLTTGEYREIHRILR